MTDVAQSAGQAGTDTSSDSDVSITAPRRRILLSAFACSPLWGSEPGVGWQWALALGHHHDVTVITHAYFRSHIEALQQAGKTPGLEFVWFRTPWIGGHPHTQLNSRSYYWLWQWALRRHVKALLRERSFDLIHHLTWGTYRLPSFLGGLGVALVVGPVGGGEGAPARLHASWPWRERLFYRVRQASIFASRWDPFVRWSMAHTDLVLTKTRETRAALPVFAQARAVEASEIGVDSRSIAAARTRPSNPDLTLVYAGRLLGGKGIPYVIDMMRLLKTRGVGARLMVAGDGRLAEWTASRITALDLHSHVTLLGKVPRERMPALFDAADLLVFPSWHDSSGNVVTEALSRGVPVLCLDIGGPRYVLDPDCGIVVGTTGLDEAGLAAAMADAVVALDADRPRLAWLSCGALERARRMSWQRQVRLAYTLIDQRVTWRERAAHAEPDTA